MAWLRGGVRSRVLGLSWLRGLGAFGVAGPSGGGDDLSDGVGLRLSSLSHGDDLGGVTRRDGVLNCDVNSDGRGGRASCGNVGNVGDSGNTGSGDSGRLCGLLGLGCINASLRDIGSCSRGMDRIDGHSGRVRCVDRCHDSLGRPAGGQVSAVNRVVTALSNGSATGYPGICRGGDGLGDIMGRLRFVCRWCGGS